MKTGYNFDQTTNTVTISSSFAKKASQVGTPEYDILLKLRKDNPNLKIEKEVKTGKPQLTYKTMEEFINLHHNKVELKKAFENAKTLSRFHSMPFSFVKAWFEKTFPYFKDGNYEMDAEGCIVGVKPSEKAEGNNTQSESEAPIQTLEVLKNQDSEEVKAETPENASLAEAV